MTITQMKYFLETARQLNFTLAADRLYVTQPTLSRQIISMEQELGVRLFIRSNNTVWLTPEGRELYDGLQRLCDDYDGICKRVEEVSQGITGELRFAVLDDQLINDSVTASITRFHKENPQITIKFSRMDFKNIHAAILAGDIDLGLSFKHNDDFDNRIGFVEVESEPMFLALEKSLDFPDFKEFHGDIMPNITNIPFLMLSQSCFEQRASLHATDWWYALVQESRGKMYFVDSVASLPLYVSLGLGMTMVNRTHALSIDPNVKLIPFPDSPSVCKALSYNIRNVNPIVNKYLETFGEAKS